MVEVVSMRFSLTHILYALISNGRTVFGLRGMASIQRLPPLARERKRHLLQVFRDAVLYQDDVESW